MKDYFQEYEYILNDLQFDYLGRRYRGRGVMTWKPQQGFHIEAPLNLQKNTLLEEIEFGKIRPIRKSDKSSIRMFPMDNYNWAIAPNVTFIDRFDIISEHRLSINLSRVIFTKYYSKDLTGDYLHGSAIYETQNINSLFDQVTLTEKISFYQKEFSENSHYQSTLEFRLDSRKRLSSAEFIKHKLPG
jgi:hypothetical protein